MFKTMSVTKGSEQRIVEFFVDERRVTASEGEMLAVALLNAGAVPFRHTAVSGQPRAPLCLMGVCFDCLVEVDGMPNVQSCMVQVKAGMEVRLPSGAPTVMESE